MNGRYTIVLLILIAAFVITLTKLYGYSAEKKLRNLVAWSVSGASRDLPLWQYISNAQIDLGIKGEYRITGDTEWEFARKILEEYQKYLSKSYFDDRLELIKSKYVIPEDHYFMFTLQHFLEDHQCDYTFIGYEMHEDTISYKQYGSWGGPRFNAKYALSEFSVVYHKLYLISYLSYMKSNVLNPEKKPPKKEKHIREILDTKQIEISRI